MSATAAIPSAAPAAHSSSLGELRQAFDTAVGGTFYRTMMKSLRSTTGEAAYFNGGQAEKIFQSQLDEHFADSLSRSHGARFADSMYPALERRVLASASERNKPVQEGASNGLDAVI